MPFEPFLSFWRQKTIIPNVSSSKKTSQILNTNFKDERSAILANTHDISAFASKRLLAQR
jgi:hypothetical protein